MAAFRGVRQTTGVALVTGATSGIGRAAALELARRGAHVLAVGRDGEALAEVCAATGGEAIRADLAEPGAAARVAAEAGPVDVLVEAAGAGLYGPVTALEDAEVERLVAVNVTAPIQLTNAVLPAMLERGSGHVVVVGSIAGRVGRGNEAAYAATKAAAAVFADSLRDELRGTGVGVSLVTPGVVDTAFFARRGVPYDRGWPRPIAPERVAQAIVRAIEGNRAEVVVPGWLSLAARARGAAPGLYRVLSALFDSPGSRQPSRVPTP